MSAPNLPVVAYLPAKHRASCAVHDPVPDYCDCGAQPVPLVRLSDAQAALAPTASTSQESKVVTNAEIDEIVYQCRQSGDDSTYAVVRAALALANGEAK